jgi:hypothetical protein
MAAELVSLRSSIRKSGLGLNRSFTPTPQILPVCFSDECEPNCFVCGGADCIECTFECAVCITWEGLL